MGGGEEEEEEELDFLHDGDKECRVRYAAAMDAISRGSALKRDRIAQQGDMVKGRGSSQNRGSFIAF